LLRNGTDRFSDAASLFDANVGQFIEICTIFIHDRDEDMKNVLTAGAALLLTTTIAQAGGLDRSGQGVGIIFEEGNLVQLSFGYISPEVSGETVNAVGMAPPGQESGNMASAYAQFGGGIKYAYSDQIDVALIIDQPYGANVDYSDADPFYYSGPATAEVNSTAITALGRYKLDDNISFHGGVRFQTVQTSVELPRPASYTLDSESSSGVGFVLGAAYEIPSIALRVALTYSSKITHDIKTTENCIVTAPQQPAFCADATTTTTIDTPESINLDFQTGIAEDTLLFGSIRYAKWTQFDFKPAGYEAITGGDSLQSYDEDTFAYSVGIGRRLSDSLSAAVSVGYEAAQGGYAGNLGPTDGNISVGLGGTYTAADYKFTAGVRYIMIGDADTENPAAPGTVGSEFRDNSAIAFGMQISRSF
jgi:long-chain fatty acid transport protein